MQITRLQIVSNHIDLWRNCSKTIHLIQQRRSPAGDHDIIKRKPPSLSVGICHVYDCFRHFLNLPLGNFNVDSLTSRQDRQDHQDLAFPQVLQE